MSHPRVMVGKRRVGLASIAGLGLLAAFGHVVYPAVLGARTRRLSDAEPPDTARWPDLAVLIPAFRESRVIEEKIENVRDNGYAGRLEVIVVAEDHETAEAARRTDAIVISPRVRLGKAQALNVAAQAATSEIVVFTDANNTLEPGALAALARWFSDATVGAVAGEKRVDGSSGEGVYWRFESWLKKREARTGTTIGIVGELGAVRRSVFRALPADTIIDDLWIALDVIESGFRVVYEPDAVTREKASSTLAEEWERRSRIVAGVLHLFVERWRLLVPGASRATGQLWGHRFVRSTLGPLAHAALLGIALRRIGSSRVGQLFVAAHVLGGVALLLAWRGRSAPRPLGTLAQVLFLQLVALGGIARYLRGDPLTGWPKVDRDPHHSDVNSQNGSGSRIRD